MIFIVNFLFFCRQRQRPVPAPRRNIKQPPIANQGLAHGARTPEPKGKRRPPPIPPKPSREIPQTQTRPTSPPVQHSTSPRLHVMSPVPAESSAASMVQNQRAALQAVVTSKFIVLHWV